MTRFHGFVILAAFSLSCFPACGPEDDSGTHGTSPPVFPTAGESQLDPDAVPEVITPNEGPMGRPDIIIVSDGDEAEEEPPLQAFPPSAGGSDAEESCIPDCETTECGSDGCGGLCGVCGDGSSCDERGQCQDAPAGCRPNCQRNSCGDDGCGGVCGTCVDGAECVPLAGQRIPGRACSWDEYPADTASEMCPPDASRYGIEPGDIVPEAPLLYCGSHQPINHRGMCANTLTLTYQLNVDCAPCMMYVNEVLGPLHAQYASQGLEIYVVYDDPAECENTRYFRNDAANLQFIYQPNLFGYAFIFSFGGKATALLMSEGNEIIYYGKGDNPRYSGPSPEHLSEMIDAQLTP